MTETDYTQSNLASKILEASIQIEKKSRSGYGNFIITSGFVSNYIKNGFIRTSRMIKIEKIYINKFDIILKLPDELKHLEHTVSIKPTKCINRIEKIKRIFKIL